MHCSNYTTEQALHFVGVEKSTDTLVIHVSITVKKNVESIFITIRQVTSCVSFCVLLGSRCASSKNYWYKLQTFDPESRFLAAPVFRWSVS